MFPLSQLKDQKGQTLLLLIGLIAVVGAVVLEVRHRYAEKKQHQRQAVLRDQSEWVLQSFAARLQNPETCTDVLAGEFVKPGQANEIALRFVLDDTVDPESRALGAGAKVASGLSLVSLRLATPEIEDMRTEVLDSHGVNTPLVRYPVYLQVEFQNDKGESVAPNRPPNYQGHPLFVWVNPLDGQILSCFGRDSTGALCNDLGGYFIPNAKPYHLSCRQSLKTERRLASGLSPRGTCRVAGLSSSAKNCHKTLQSPFAGNLLQQSQKRFAPEMADQYLCELCQ